MRLIFDLDETLCTGYPYKDSVPKPGAADRLKFYKNQGHEIIIQTARGMGTNAGNPGAALSKIGLLTMQQLKDWDFVYDELWFGKPAGDIYIDDKSCKSLLELEELLCQ